MTTLTRIACLSAPALVCFVASTGLAQTIPCETYTLANGMRVTLMEDHALPRASVNLWYRVGARNEPPGRSGFAHLFEHLMFMGTKRVPGSDFDNLMETGGGSNNASTSLDRTNYYSSGPSSLLPTLLWLDADRLEDMGLMMNKEKLGKQLDVVRNERRQVVEETPYARAYEASLQVLYPRDHPYYNGVIGTHADLEAAQVDDVKNFFSTFYTPGNCSLIVAGDFDPAAIKPLVEKLYGSLPPGNTAPRTGVPMPRLDRVHRATYLDKVQLPAVGFSFHSPGQYTEGDAEMDLVGLVLGDGKSSRLYQRLVVRDKLATEVSASQDSAALSSVFRVTVMTLPDADLAKVEAAMDEELARLIADGPTAAELEQRRTQIEVNKLTRLQSIEARADALNEYLYYFGENDPTFNPADGLKRDLDRYRNATSASVRTWAARVLTPKAKLVQHVLPEEPERAESGRDARPADAPSAPFVPPTPAAFSFGGDIDVMVFNRPELPLVSVGMLFTPPAGTTWDHSERSGRTRLMASMLSEGTGDLDGATFAARLQELGASFSAAPDVEGFTVTLNSLKKNLDAAFSLAAKAVRAPRMNAADFDRVKQVRLSSIRQENEEPRAVAPKVSAAWQYGGASAYGSPLGGTVKSIEVLTLGDVQRSHGKVTHGKLTIVLAGDVSESDARTLLEKHLGSWDRPAPAETDPGAEVSGSQVTGKGPRVFIVNRPGAVQTMLHLRAPSVPAADPRSIGLRAMNTALGGSFTSRLNNNLREVNGWTYGARTGFNLRSTTGDFTAGSSVVATATGPALKEFMGELKRIASGDLTAAEVQKAREVTTDNLVEPFGSIGGVVGVALDAVETRLPWSSLAADFAALKKVDAGSLNGVAGKAVDLSNAVLVLVGDRDVIRQQLESV
ncbi:MAG: pitrilysin family protein, partial [Phycisphaerales bacterium]|nr:pitrilysin family protein [Phycisphaerales bacterium]